MTLLALAHDLRIELKKTSNCRGGEYHGACPSCGDGIDRFVIWPQLNRYWCRRCGIRGDSIQFCRDFMTMSFHEAYERVNSEPFCLFNQGQHKRIIREKFTIIQEPPKQWQDKALAFVEWAQKQLKHYPQAMKELSRRGFQESTILQFKLGYCINSSLLSKRDLYRERTDWGLSCEYREDGKVRKLWLPNGLVIPTISKSGSILKLKVRRDQWHKEDRLPKYVEISGSMACPSIYGNTDLEIAIVLESELDAQLIQQVANDLCFCVALGGASKRPDLQTDLFLKEAKLILWCLDNDEAGKSAAFWWRETYSHLKFWLVPIGKSPGDALQHHNINLRDWILTGITHYFQKKSIYNQM